MSYPSQQVEGKTRKQDTWICHHCSFDDNQVNLTQCQYCGMLRFDPTQQMQPQTHQPHQMQPYIHAQPSLLHQEQQYDQYDQYPSYPSQEFDTSSAYIQPQTQSVTTSITVNVNFNNNNRDVLEKQKPFVMNEEYKPYYEEDVDNYKAYSCCFSVIRLFVWLFICGGLVTSIWWFVCAIIYMYWFKPCFKISKYLIFGLCSRNNYLRLKTKCKCYDSKGKNARNCCCDGCFIFIWMLIFGVPSTMLHLMFGIISLPFLMVGFNFCFIHFRLVKIALFNPYAVEIDTRR